MAAGYRQKFIIRFIKVLLLLDYKSFTFEDVFLNLSWRLFFGEEMMGDMMR